LTQGMACKRIITDGKRFKRIIDIEQSGKLFLPQGHIEIEELKVIPIGHAFTVQDRTYYLFDCDIHDFLSIGLKRRTQIIYPKESGYIILKMDISSGKKVGEAGTGSGAMTLQFSRAVGREGEVYSYEKEKDFVKLAEKNLRDGAEFENVTIHNQLLEDGIHESNLDGFFLDIKKPWEALDVVLNALKPGGHLCFFVPTTNQVSYILKGLKTHGCVLTEVEEILKRSYKLNPARFRPVDKMIAHTGYLIFSRKVVKGEE